MGSREQVKFMVRTIPVSPHRLGAARIIVTGSNVMVED
jgi:hypothetical protein